MHDMNKVMHNLVNDSHELNTFMHGFDKDSHDFNEFMLDLKTSPKFKKLRGGYDEHYFSF